MVEVFKTNIRTAGQAMIVKNRIQEIFVDYEINFDLQDCDHILRVKCLSVSIETDRLIALLGESGFYAEVLQDVCPPNH